MVPLPVMKIDLQQHDSAFVYRTLIQTIVPRPIAWILSDSGEGRYNLAPFSFFNAVTSDPPLISVSIGHKRSGEKKDTWLNLEQRRYFTLHIASTSHAEQVSGTAASLAHSESEVEQNQIELVPEAGFHLPRIKNASVAMDCELEQILEIGNGPQGLILARIHKIFIDDQIIAANDPTQPIFQINYSQLSPLARLGGNDFSGITPKFTVKRPE